jgi:hypothetical protein
MTYWLCAVCGRVAGVVCYGLMDVVTNTDKL